MELFQKLSSKIIQKNVHLGMKVKLSKQPNNADTDLSYDQKGARLLYIFQILVYRAQQVIFS